MKTYKRSIANNKDTELPITPGYTFSYARVLKTILSEGDEYYDRLGRSKSMCGILYRKLGAVEDEEVLEDKNFAIPFFSNYRKPPLPGEIVLIVNAPGTDQVDTIYNTTYYLETVGIWNHPHFNILPDESKKSTYFDGEDITIEGNFEDIGETVNPLKLFQGDISIEGRSGNSIRFGGVTNTNNTAITSEDTMSPYIIIRNGRFQAENGLLTKVENINTDDSSIYLTSNHTVPLLQDVRIRNTYKNLSNRPDSVESYSGNQVILSSGRLIFNANKDLILLTTVGDIEMSSKRIHIESEDFVALDSKKIYLGRGSLEERQAAILGTETVEWLRDFVLRLKRAFTNISEAGPDARPFVAATIKETASIVEGLEPLLKRLENLSSKKTFIE